MSRYYLLKGRSIVPAKNIDEAMQALSDIDNRTVARTIVDEIEVSTVFLILDHRLSGDGPPVLFETMCFSVSSTPYNEVGDWTRRYCTYQDALDGHNATVDALRAMLKSSADIATQSINTHQENTND